MKFQALIALTLIAFSLCSYNRRHHSFKSAAGVVTLPEVPTFEEPKDRSVIVTFRKQNEMHLSGTTLYKANFLISCLNSKMKLYKNPICEEGLVFLAERQPDAKTDIPSDLGKVIHDYGSTSLYKVLKWSEINMIDMTTLESRVDVHIYPYTIGLKFEEVAEVGDNKQVGAKIPAFQSSFSSNTLRTFFNSIQTAFDFYTFEKVIFPQIKKCIENPPLKMMKTFREQINVVLAPEKADKKKGLSEGLKNIRSVVENLFNKGKSNKEATIKITEELQKQEGFQIARQAFINQYRFFFEDKNASHPTYLKRTLEFLEAEPTTGDADKEESRKILIERFNKIK